MTLPPRPKCKYGHDLTPDNICVYVDRGARTHRECRRCKMDRRRVKREDSWPERKPLPIPAFLNVIRKGTTMGPAQPTKAATAASRSSPLCPECKWYLVMDWRKHYWFCHRCNGHVWKDQRGVHVGGKGEFMRKTTDPGLQNAGHRAQG
jgi:hypothetical protein